MSGERDGQYPLSEGEQIKPRRHGEHRDILFQDSKTHKLKNSKTHQLTRLLDLLREFYVLYNFKIRKVRDNLIYIRVFFRTMTIRKAKPADAGAISPLLLLAMEEVFYEFIGTNSYSVAEPFLRELVKTKSNQYSYENCHVVEIDNAIAGVSCVYPGEQLQQLRKKVALHIKKAFNRNFNPEDETEPGEYYIDCVAVNPEFQGKGIGSALFNFLIKEFVSNQQKPLGLLVDLDNPQAKRLYKRLGFQVVKQKTLTGKVFDHMQMKP